jgi:single-strand DNA-binding protein
MSGTPITIVGNLGGDPDLRFTPSGAPVASFSVAVAESKLNRETGKFEDDGTTWYRVSAWRNLAENIAESLTSGMRVIVMGSIRSREWTDKESGEKRVGWEIQATNVGPDLTWATAKVVKSQKANGGAPAPEDPRGTGTAVHRTRPAAPAQGDDWSKQEPAQGWGGGYSDEPPF